MEDDRNEAVAVTGAGGFIGRHVVAGLLAAGRSVEAIVRDAPGGLDPAAPGLRLHRLDMLDVEAVKRWVGELRPRILVHLAWITTPGVYFSSPENERWADAGAVLFEEVVRHGGRRIVGVGSCMEYAATESACREDSTPIAPATAYGRSKHALHERLIALCRGGAASGAWARIFFCFGPGEARGRLVPSVIESALSGQPVRCSQGTQLRDYLYVKDVAGALAALATSSVEGAVNIGSGLPRPVFDLVSTVVARCRTGVPILRGSVPTRPHEPPCIVADVRRLAKDLTWSPRHDFNGAIDETIQWWQERR